MKRLRVIKEVDGIMLQPINPEYAPKKYDYTDDFNPVYYNWCSN